MTKRDADSNMKFAISEAPKLTRNQGWLGGGGGRENKCLMHPLMVMSNFAS